MVQKRIYLRKLHYVNNGYDMWEEFGMIAKQDKQVAYVT